MWSCQKVRIYSTRTLTFASSAKKEETQVSSFVIFELVLVSASFWNSELNSAWTFFDRKTLSQSGQIWHQPAYRQEEPSQIPKNISITFFVFLLDYLDQQYLIWSLKMRSNIGTEFQSQLRQRGALFKWNPIGSNGKYQEIGDCT